MHVPMSIDSESSVPVYRQIYNRLRQSILSGALAPGTRVVSTRELARQLNVARTTVTTAYEHLVAEGYLQATHGAWTFVAQDLPDYPLSRSASTIHRERGLLPKVTPMGRWLVERAQTLEDPFERDVEFNFRRTSTPAMDVFPVDEWRRLVTEHWRRVTPESMTGQPSQGYRPLRIEIARHIRVARGIECDPDQIVITSGTEQSMDILTRVFLQPGDTVAVEDPTRVAIQTLFRAYRASLQPIPVDADGIVVDALAGVGRRPPALLYITPTHQYPTGAILTLQRRIELLRWATRRRVLVVEDDCDSGFSYDGATLEALQALDTTGVVVYLETFIKVLSASIRIGFMIVPPSLVAPAVAAQRIIGRQTESVHQAVLAEFMATGGFARHLRRLRRIHMARRDCLIEALRHEFDDDVVIGPGRSGVHLHVRWRSHAITPEVIDRGLAAGVAVVPVRPMYVRTPAEDPGLALSFASLPEHRIGEGIARLAHVMSSAPTTTIG